MKYIDYERYHVVRDDRGIVWISTYGNGLFTYDIQEDRLEHFVSEGKNAGPIGSDFLLCLMKDRTGGIWVSSEYSGLSHISISNKGITHVYPESPVHWANMKERQYIRQIAWHQAPQAHLHLIVVRKTSFFYLICQQR